MGTSTQLDVAAFERAIEEQKARVAAEAKDQSEKVAAALHATASAHPTALLGGMVGAAKPESFAAANVSHEEFAKTMDAMRQHYAAATPSVRMEAFRLPTHLAAVPVPVSAAKPNAAPSIHANLESAAPALLALTKEGVEATNKLLQQSHQQTIALVQTHTAAVFEALKTFSQNRDVAAFNQKVEAAGAAMKAQVNATIDKIIDQALALGQKHADQHSALATVANTIAQALGSASHAIGSAATAAVHTVANAAKDVGGAVSKAVQDVGHAASSAIHSVAHFFGL